MVRWSLQACGRTHACWLLQRLTGLLRDARYGCCKLNVPAGCLLSSDACHVSLRRGVLPHVPTQVRARWRAVTSNPEFWSEINLKGRTVQVSKVRCAVAAGLGWCCVSFAGSGEAAWLLGLCSGCRVCGAACSAFECLRLYCCRHCCRPFASCCLQAEAHSRPPHPSPPLPCPQVRHLLSQHNGVKVLNARGVAFAPSDLAFLLPQLT